MNIRRATTQDVDAIHALGQSVAEFSVNEGTITFWPKELLTQAVRSDDVLIFVAEDTELVGFIIVNLNRGLKKAIIENVYVHPDQRGRGIGDKLLDSVVELLPSLGCEYIATLIPTEAKGAFELYVRNGFSTGETFLWLDKFLDNSFKQEQQS